MPSELVTELTDPLPVPHAEPVVERLPFASTWTQLVVKPPSVDTVSDVEDAAPDTEMPVVEAYGIVIALASGAVASFEPSE